MAYLSDSDENEQQQQSQGQTQGNQGFNIYLPASSAQGGASQSGAPPQGAAAQIAQKSAAEYSQPIGASAAPGMDTPNASKPLEPQDNPMAPGMGQASTAAGNVPGAQQNGYINFSNYLNSNPSMAGQVSDYGNKALAAGNTAFNKAQSDYAANSGQSQFSDPWSGDQPTEQSIEAKISSGQQLSADDIRTLQGYGIESYNGATGSSYAPSQAFNSALGSFGVNSGGGPNSYGANQAGTLTQQLYAQQKPSLQQEVTPGTTALDTALLQADPNVQKAVGAQQAQLGSLNSKANQATADDAAQYGLYQKEAQDIQKAQQGAIQSVTDKINAAEAANPGNPSAGMRQDLNNFLSWWNNGHPATQQDWSVATPGTEASGLGQGDQTTATNLALVQGNPAPQFGTGTAPVVSETAYTPKQQATSSQMQAYQQQLSQLQALLDEHPQWANTNVSFGPGGDIVVGNDGAPPLTQQIATLKGEISSDQSQLPSEMTPAQYAHALGFTDAQIQAMGLSSTNTPGPTTDAYLTELGYTPEQIAAMQGQTGGFSPKQTPGNWK